MRELLHISDVHFGPHFLPEVADGVLELVERRRPDLVVVSGDLTQRAKPRQFQDARAWIDSMPVPTICVPGNHDVPMYRAWERLFQPYGAYRRHFDDELQPTFEDDELYVIGTNTAFNWTVKDGRFTASALRRLAGLLQSAPEGKARIVVAHHHLIPPPRFDTRRVTFRAQEALELFARFRVDMVLSGHLHQTYISTSEEYYPRGRRPVLLVHTGTTTSGRGRGWEKGRNSCNWIRLGAEVATVHHLLWQPGSRAFEEWSRHSYPRQRLGSFSLLGSLDDAVS
ncbi:MAG: metallophosphoesterase [Holophagales bacterium]|nr:metallophosphoesterase [Holophagales bacterium]